MPGIGNGTSMVCQTMFNVVQYLYCSRSTTVGRVRSSDYNMCARFHLSDVSCDVMSSLWTHSIKNQNRQLFLLSCTFIVHASPFTRVQGWRQVVDSQVLILATVRVSRQVVSCAAGCGIEAWSIWRLTITQPIYHIALCHTVSHSSTCTTYSSTNIFTLSYLSEWYCSTGYWYQVHALLAVYHTS